MTMPATHQRFRSAISGRIQSDSATLAARWLDRLKALVPVEPNEIFPTATILDHIPELIVEIGRIIGAPVDESAGNTFIVAKAREIGLLRHAQQASVHQSLREYELLRSILEAFVAEQAAAVGSVRIAEVVDCIRRINESIASLTQTTVSTLLERYNVTIAEQTRRLEGFNHLISHEVRQPLSAIQTAVRLWRVTEDEPDNVRREKVINAIERSADHLIEVVNTATRVAALQATDTAKLGEQRISLGTAAREVARQLRDMAQDRGVQLRIAGDCPDITVDVARLALILTNLISNGIKYCDPEKAERYVNVSTPATKSSECRFEVADNGIGMTPDQLRQMFTPFYRGQDKALRIAGLGLGLTIVRDCVDALGGTMTADSTPGVGTTFTVTIPSNANAHTMEAAPAVDTAAGGVKDRRRFKRFS